MKILVEQNSTVLAGVALQLGIEHDNPARDVGFGIRVIAPAVAQTAAVPDFDLVAVKQFGDG